MRASGPPIDPAVGVIHPLPPELQASLHPFQRKMRSVLGLIIFIAIAFFSVGVPVISVPPVFFLLEHLGVIPHQVSRRFFDLCTAHWITMMTRVTDHAEILFGIKIRTFGCDVRFKKRSLIIMNHVSHFDWIYLWDVVDRQGDMSYWKAITKIAPFRHVPILGYCMQLSCFFFISRKWEVDKLEFQRKLYYFNAIDYPIQLLLFPEGSDLTPRTRQHSDKYAKKNHLACYQYCLHPRTTGFNYIMNAMREGGLDAVYDVTIGYPDVLPKTEIDAWRGIYPKEIHFHMRSYGNEDIPEDEEGMKKWLGERWLEKEERLKHFYTHREFKEPAVTDVDLENSHMANEDRNVTKDSLVKSPEVVNPHNIPFLLRSLFIIVLTNVATILPWLFIPYFSVYMLFAAVFTIYHSYWDYSSYVMSFKQREVEEALRKSKHD